MEIKTAFLKALNSIYNSLPILLGVILLVSLSNVLIPKEFYLTIFRGNLLIDSLIGSALGSVLAGNPITSYILGGEMLNQGVNLIVVTSFMVAWVTVGIVQLPAESVLLGKKFAIYRNISAFIFSIAVSIVTYLLVMAI